MFNKGDKSKAICPVCKDITTTTMTNCDFSYTPIAIGGVTQNILVQGVLHGVCDECGEIVSIPHQSLPYIQAMHKKLEELIGDNNYDEPL